MQTEEQLWVDKCYRAKLIFYKEAFAYIGVDVVCRGTMLYLVDSFQLKRSEVQEVLPSIA